MKGDYDKRIMLNYKAQKEYKRNRFWHSRRNSRFLGDTYKYWSLKYLFLFLILTALIVYVIVYCESTLVEWCNRMLSFV